jgi:hypothetical protein
MDEHDDLFTAIASRWFWVAAAFFLVIQYGNWIKIHWIWGIFLAGLIALVNVAVMFGLMAWVFTKTKWSPNIFLTVAILLVANMITLLVFSPFVPNDFKGIGDYFIGSLVMVLLVGAAQSIPEMFKLGH